MLLRIKAGLIKLLHYGESATAPVVEPNPAGARAVAIGASYAGGTDSFAAMIGDNSSTYGATGANAVAVGFHAKASGTRALALGGTTNSASGSDSAALGGGNNSAGGTNTACVGGTYNTTSGNSSGAFAGGANTVSGLYAVALGGANNYIGHDYGFELGCYGSSVTAQYQGLMLGKISAPLPHRFAQFQGMDLDMFTGSVAGGLGSPTRMHGGNYSARVLTTDATATPLTDGVAVNTIAMPSDWSVVVFDALICCMRIDGASVGANPGFGGYRVTGVAKRGSGAASVAQLAAATVTTIGELTETTQNITVTYDTTNGGININAVGIAAKTFLWVAQISTVELTIG